MCEDFVHCVTQHDERRDGLAGRYQRHSFEGASKDAGDTVEFSRVSFLDQLLGGVAEGPVPDVVQKSCEAGGVAIFRAYLGYVFVAIRAEAPSMIGVPFERADHALRGFYDTLYVLEAIMPGTRIDEMRHAELAHAS